MYCLEYGGIWYWYEISRLELKGILSLFPLWPASSRLKPAMVRRLIVDAGKPICYTAPGSAAPTREPPKTPHVAPSRRAEETDLSLRQEGASLPAHLPTSRARSSLRSRPGQPVRKAWYIVHRHKATGPKGQTTSIFHNAKLRKLWTENARRLG